MKLILPVIILLILVTACGKSDSKQKSVDLITEPSEQEKVFQDLLSLTDSSISTVMQQDSLAFLILPVEASCPACRKKTIDSIMKHKDNLLDRRFIIISGAGTRKILGSYFMEQNYRLPEIKNRLFLDSTYHAHKAKLYTTNPTLYYTFNRKAYKRISAVPSTVKEDLREFFSGYREVKK